jgi:hypothetical protein
MTDRIGGPKGPMVSQPPAAKAEGAKAAGAQVKVEGATPDEGAAPGGMGERFERVQLGRMQQLLGGSSLQVDGIDEGKPAESSEPVAGRPQGSQGFASGSKLADPLALKWSRGVDLATAAEGSERAPTSGATASKAFEGAAKMEGYAKVWSAAKMESAAKVWSAAKMEGLSKMEGAAKAIQDEAASKHYPGAFNFDGRFK